tara:strand:+ start:149 stop:844 length:696 start_codon:yes stop_codon:yes gene_type:complete
MSSLYVIPTPIGNLKDITLRALETLKNVDYILAEDTRVVKKLLNHYEINTPIKAYHQHNEHKIYKKIVNEILEQQIEVGLVSDAGTPGISDPGFLLIREAINNNINVVSLPGPTALIPALLQSGFSSDSFVFEGFLPHKKGRKSKLSSLITENRTVILYESPHRLLKLLQEINDLFESNRKIAVTREISKIYEETKIGSAGELLEYYKNNKPKGEIVVVLSKQDKKSQKAT